MVSNNQIIWHHKATMENLLTPDEIDWLCKFLEGKGSNNETIVKIVTITSKLQKMKRK